jgi:hypothetical protein
MTPMSVFAITPKLISGSISTYDRLTENRAAKPPDVGGSWAEIGPKDAKKNQAASGLIC